MDFSFNDNSQCSVGLENSERAEIKVFPNPSQGIIQVELSGELSEDLKVEIYSMNGQMVHEQKIINQSIFQLEISVLLPMILSFAISS